MEEGRSSFKILTGTPTGKRPLERPRRRWENNVRMNIKETDEELGRFGPGYGLLENPCECGIEPTDSGSNIEGDLGMAGPH